MSITCPDCHAALEPQNGIAHCDSCNKDIPLEARCPDCHQPLQVLGLRRGGLLLSERPRADLKNASSSSGLGLNRTRSLLLLP